MKPLRIMVEDVGGVKIASEESYEKWLANYGRLCLLDSDGDQVPFELLVDGGTYTLGPPIQQQQGNAISEPPIKRTKVRDTRNDTQVKENKCVDLTVDCLKILSPENNATEVRYFGRRGIPELFDILADSQDAEKSFNIEFVGAPGTGKSNLVWAVADHLAQKGESVIWASRRTRREKWSVRHFDDKGVSKFEDLPQNLGAILDLPVFSNSKVLILDAPLAVSGAGDDGTKGYEWAGNTSEYGTRKNGRRVIHVSSLGASTQKGTEVHHFNLRELVINPWTRNDFIEALGDEKLKEKVCQTLQINDVASVTAEELVDSKFFYSGINARWFFNFSITEIKNECKKILARLSPSATQVGDTHLEAVNSALQHYWVGDRQVMLFTSSYLALAIGKDGNGTQLFLNNFPLIREYLGNGAPGEIFEADFAIHLQHCHDLADAQRAVMGNKAQRVDVQLGTLEDSSRVTWPTGNLYKLPAVSNQGMSYQKLPEKAIRDLKTSDEAQWFIPENKSQPFLDFFVLVPGHNNKWQFRAIQNTVGRSHSADMEQLKRVVGGVLQGGYILTDKIVVAFVIEDHKRQQNIGLKGASSFTLCNTAGTRSKGAQTQEFSIEEMRVKFNRTADTPR